MKDPCPRRQGRAVSLSSEQRKSSWPQPLVTGSPAASLWTFAASSAKHSVLTRVVTKLSELPPCAVRAAVSYLRRPAGWPGCGPVPSQPDDVAGLQGRSAGCWTRARIWAGRAKRLGEAAWCVLLIPRRHHTQRLHWLGTAAARCLKLHRSISPQQRGASIVRRTDLREGAYCAHQRWRRAQQSGSQMLVPALALAAHTAGTTAAWRRSSSRRW